MQNQKTGCAVLLVTMLALTGCASAEPSGSVQETTTAAATTVTTTTAVTAADTSASLPAETTAEPEEDYVHGSDGYYCLLDEMPDYIRRMQTAGTCCIKALLTNDAA